MKTSQPKIIRFENSFFEMVKKFYDASHVHYLAFFPWFFWSLFNVSLHLRLNLINLGKLQCSFDVWEVANPPRTWQGFQMSHLLGLNEKKLTAKICQILLTNFFTKIGLFEILFFYIFVNIFSFVQHIWACITIFFAYEYQKFTEFKPILINQKLNLWYFKEPVLFFMIHTLD